MPRSARVIGDGGFFHVMVRGVNKQDIFLDESDYRYYLDALEKYKAEEEIEIYAWCLMTNHVHLLLKATKESLAAFLKKVGCKYVPYFNKKYERIGHLFQERFRSEVIDSDEYLLTAARYIHQNPYKAGMAQSLWYRWSSYGEYFNQGGLADVSLLLSMLGDLPSFERFMNQLEERPCYALEFRPTDEEAAMYIH